MLRGKIILVGILTSISTPAFAQCDPYPDVGPGGGAGRMHRCSYGIRGPMFGMPDSYMRQAPGWMSRGGYNLYNGVQPNEYPVHPYAGVNRYFGPPPGTWGW